MKLITLIYRGNAYIFYACVCVQLFSYVQLFTSPWAVVCQAPLSMEFSRQEYWRGLPFPSPGNLSHLGTETVSLCISCVGRQILYHHTPWEDAWKDTMYTYYFFQISSYCWLCLNNFISSVSLTFIASPRRNDMSLSSLKSYSGRWMRKEIEGPVCLNFLGLSKQRTASWMA